MPEDKFRLPEGAAPHYHDGDPVGTDPFTPTEAEREYLGDLLIPVHSEGESNSEETEDSDESGSEDESQAALDPSEYTIDELESELATGDYDDVLDEIREVEASQGNRDGALEAIDERAETTGEGLGGDDGTA